ncbi:MAG TPA: FAD-dependent oxidoreductase [Solirubrobacteraceae bacterium]|nr:FAD-dependent oxidoreductase [Solirubrobacteraceae bacterium]
MVVSENGTPTESGQQPVVTVIGGGMIGLCTAWELARRGASVTVIDRDRMGGATSRGNTGWVVPALSAPIAAPGSVKQGLQLISRRDNPFYIKPRPSPALANWLVSFVRSARPERFRAGTDAILAINQRTLELFDGLRSAGVEFEMHGGGLLFLCLSEAALDGTAQRFAKLGYGGEIERLTAREVLALEPGVAPSVIGALHVKPERFIRPETLSQGLVKALSDLGVRLVENQTVTALRRVSHEWRIDTAHERFVADRVVISAGIWSRELLRPLGLNLPLQAGKGYSVTTRGSGVPPQRAAFFVEAMIGAAPYDGAVRLAGMLELSGMDDSLKRRRLEAVYRAARAYLSGWQPGDAELEWAGLRPMTPDGLPIVGAVPGHPGAFLSTGHGMVGVTLAPATAALLAPLVLTGQSAPELWPVRADR